MLWDNVLTITDENLLQQGFVQSDFLSIISDIWYRRSLQFDGASPSPYIRLKAPTLADFPYEWQPWHRVASIYTSACQADGKFGLVVDLSGWVAREI
ncbi:hypothetical protein E2C01_031312 [Portunus trituberculatus]|uniref:Uncharacterized protein n=1 Tax=Portunus trituberculatus TaxID=210409 RepID=A0A5B7EXS7_PORTR|nr:hypothetical protein [Portunus trituberculatus]